MTGNALDDEAIRREHNGADIGFCSETCVEQWEALPPEERAAKLAGK